MSGLMQIGCRVFQANLDKDNKIVMSERVWVGLTEAGERRKCILAKPRSVGGYDPTTLLVVPYEGVGPEGWTTPERYARKVIAGSILSEIRRRKDEIAVLEKQLETTND